MAGHIVIHGTVRSGSGKASKAMQGAKFEERSRVAGMDLVPGTLNIAVDDLDAALAALGEPDRLSEIESKHGPLWWWPVWIMLGRDGDGHMLEAAAWVVRHELSTAPYLEMVSRFHFRRVGLEDGFPVQLRERTP